MLEPDASLESDGATVIAPIHPGRSSKERPLPNPVPPEPSVTLYAGEVMHHRLRPKRHRFVYKVYSTLVDLDRRHEIGGLSRFLSHNRWNLFSIHDKDHGPADGGDLRSWADNLFHEAGLEKRPFRIMLLCYPRIFGAVFNPLSVYFAYDEKNRLVGVIYEVRNTFGERHSYVATVKKGELTASGLRQSRKKLFYVSPLMDMDMRYHFHLKPPGDAIAVRILETDAAGPFLVATFHGTAQLVSSRTLAQQAIRVPFQTFKVVAAIHYEALRIWLKGVRLRDRPVAPPRHSTVDGVLDISGQSPKVGR